MDAVVIGKRSGRVLITLPPLIQPLLPHQLTIHPTDSLFRSLLGLSLGLLGYTIIDVEARCATLLGQWGTGSAGRS